jgi:hypothetical protein
MIEKKSDFVRQGSFDMALVLKTIAECPPGSIAPYVTPTGEDKFDDYELLGPELRCMTEILMQDPCVEVLASSTQTMEVLEAEEGCLDR